LRAFDCGAGRRPARRHDRGGLYFNGGSINYYDPANGYVPSGSGNSASASITAPGAFAFFENKANTDTATFSATSLTIEDLRVGGSFPWRQVFTTDDPGYFDGLALADDNFPGGIAFSLQETDTLTVNWGGELGRKFDDVAVFSLDAAVPEPPLWAMLLNGFAGLAAFGVRSGSRRAT